jgi:LacI family transcriptional regulator
MQGGSGSVTIHEVAEKAGVSIKTVSRVINHEANVRADTKERVLAVIAELNYRPNPSARHLAGTHGYNIALLYDNPSASYLMDLQRGALESCQIEGFHLILQPCGLKDQDLEATINNLIVESRVPGLILSPPLSDAGGLIDRLEGWGVLHARIAPIDVARQGPYVAVDDRGAAFELISHLIEQGHRRIGIIKGHPDHGAGHWRYEGYLTAMRQFGLPIDEDLIVQGYFSFDSGLEAGRKLLALPDRPTAIFAANDDMAAAVLHVAHDMAIDVPGQLSVAGFDDTPLSRHVWPPLTTVRQPVQEMARQATMQLIDRIRKRGQSQSAGPSAMYCSLVIRESTGAAPARS